MSPGPVARRPERARGGRPEGAFEITVLLIMAAALVTAGVAAVVGADWRALLPLAVSAAGAAVGLRLPLPGTALIAAAPIGATLLGGDPVVPWSVAVFGALLLTRRGAPALAVGPVIAAANVVAVGLYEGTLALERPGASIACSSALVAAAAGSALRANRRYRRELEARAREAEASRASAIERSVAEERLRIARDLHDGVGHSVAVVGMHLGAAEVQLPAGPSPARDSIEAARQAVKAVLAETQQILHVLRVDGEPATTAPVAGHAMIPQLVDAARAAGMTIDDEVTGLQLDLPAQTSAAAYRIVQEALTNAARHGTGAVSLQVAATPEETMTIELVNVRADPRADPSGGGLGLAGMRERAESAGGRFEARGDGAVFWLRAVLPAGRSGA